MLKKPKNNNVVNNDEASPAKKIKKSVKIKEPNIEKNKKSFKVSKINKKTEKSKAEKSPEKSIKKSTFISGKNKAGENKLSLKLNQIKVRKDRKLEKKFEKPADWNEFKKKKKELQIKRKQSKNLYEVIVQAKKIAEDLRRKKLKEGPEERNRLTLELHTLLGGQGNYPKYVLTHDMARVVQYLLKFGSEEIRREIAQELIPVTVDMLQSKYAKFCVKKMLKYGDATTRSEVMQACYGHAVKLASHSVSSSIFDYGYTTWASAQIKRCLVQEFYGDMYKQSKDKSLTHISDAYRDSPDMKTAVLSAVKANLSRILNKKLLDSHIVQTVLMQYLQECSPEDKTEMITQLTTHIVVISNSKEGALAAMNCFWYGTNKDRKTMVKTLKEHVLNMCKHEHAYNTIIAILDSADDTVLLNKIVVSEIVAHSLDLANDEWGRRVLLWLVAPENHSYFHPNFVKQFNEGREKSLSKKDVKTRREEILNYCSESFLQQICDNTEAWLKNASVAIVTFAILKAGSGDNLKSAYKNIANIITNDAWKVPDGENETPGVEHSGFHMLLKKLLQHDKNASVHMFAPALVETLTEKTINKWIKSKTGCNRACFLMVHIIENSDENVQNELKNKISDKCKLKLEDKKEKYKGVSLLLQKIT